MTKGKKWFIAASVAALFAVNGAVMAATTADKQDVSDFRRPHFAQDCEFGPKDDIHMKFREDHQALLDLLKIDDATLRAERKAGKTLLTIANEHGVSEQALKDFFTAKMTARIDEGVKVGRISAEKAEEMKANMPQRIDNIINGKFPFHKGDRPMRGPGMFEDEKLLSLLKVDSDTLKSELRSGRTLVSIAKEHGVSEKKLKDFFVRTMTQRIDEDVKAGRLTAERAEQMKADLDKHVSDMINGKGPQPGPRHGHKHGPSEPQDY